MILTISNRPSDHSNDSISLMDPFSFNCSTNNVPPPTKPKYWLVAAIEWMENIQNTFRWQKSDMKKEMSKITHQQPNGLLEMVKTAHCIRDDSAWKMMIFLLDMNIMRQIGFKNYLFALTKTSSCEFSVSLRSESIYWFCLIDEIN